MLKGLLALLFAGACVLAAINETAAGAPLTVEVFADSMERLPDGTSSLAGNVVIVVNGIHITADYASYQPNRSVFTFASGTVRVAPVGGMKLSKMTVRIGPQHARPER